MKQFLNRTYAGEQLGKLLTDYRDQDAVVVAIPRGGVVVGYEVADALNLPLDVIVVKKVTLPEDPECAIGAMEEDGNMIFDGDEGFPLGKREFYEEKEQVREAIRLRLARYRDLFLQIDLNGKTVILVDDGAATGYTVRAALESIKKRQPKEIIVALPVLPHELTKILEDAGATVVSIIEDRDFSGSVGAYYDGFPQVTEEETMNLLQSNRTA